jgi:hypothetical protein
MAITPGYDVGGFGRLGQMKVARRAEEREERRLGIAEKSAEQKYKLGQMQLKQMESNLQKIQRQDQIKKGLGQALSNIPEGENPFTTGYNYLMMSGAPDMAQKYMDIQDDRIEQQRKLGDAKGAVDTFNQTIGKISGVTATYNKTDPIHGDLLTLVDKDDNKSYGWATKKGKFIPFDLPEGMSLDVVDDSYTLSDTEVEFLARKYIADGKKPFPVRGKESNAKNAQVIQAATNIQISEGKAGAEATFDIEERKAIQKSLVQQEKQRGSMVSFVENLGKQIDHVEDVAADIKTFDTRMFNKPAIWVKKKLMGSPEYSKYEVYLGEIQSEIGKLSSGSTASVAELSEGAREKWEKILDENLSIKDMIEVLKEVKEAGNIRMESVDYGIEKTKERLRNVGKYNRSKPKENTTPVNELSNEELLEMLNAE